MKIKKQPDDIFKEYEKAVRYNENIDLYDTVEKNQRFYKGDQWSGVNAPDMPKPVFNVIKRVISYFTAMIVSDDIGVNLSSFEETQENTSVAKILSREIDNVIEHAKVKEKTRKLIKNCAVDGDAAFYFNFNPNYDTGEEYKGIIECELIDNTNILFGNPFDHDIQKQPYVIVMQRLYTDQVKEMAKAEGLDDEYIDLIVADRDDTERDSDVLSNDENLTTVLTKFWKEKRTVEEVNELNIVTPKEIETVHFVRCTSQVIIKEDTDTGYSLYPIAYMSWEENKKSYHGQSPITGLIPNQIFINKIFAMCMIYVTDMGFPKVVYDTNKLTKLTNKIAGLGVQNLDTIGKLMDAFKAPDFSNQVINLLDYTITYTKEFMGANDAALGNMKPDNTSAIIALQEATAVPLQLQKLGFYEFMEDSIRIIIDMMSIDYGTRKCKINNKEAQELNAFEIINGQQVLMPYLDVDFNLLNKFNNQLTVTIGESTYWSEMLETQTMDNLFRNGIITDTVDYLESIPDKYLTNKQKLIDSIKEKAEKEDKFNMLVSQLSNYLPEEQMQAILSNFQ